MEINRENILSFLPLIEKTANECDFVSIDTELSGIRHNNNLFDTFQRRYEGAKNGPLNYSVIQYGLTFFKKIKNDSDILEYSCFSYNIHVFPYSIDNGPKVLQERDIKIQSGVASFLLSHNFDFNKLFKSGVNWLNINECMKYEQYLDSKKNTKNGKTKNYPEEKLKLTVDISTEEKQFADDIVIKLNDFLLNVELKKLDIEPITAYRRRIIYEILENSKFYDFLDIKTITTSANSILKPMLIEKCNDEDRKAKREQMIKEASGISSIIKFIIKNNGNNKPVVGHNLFLDILHTLHQFISPLPDKFLDFQKIAHDLFPCLFDTKYLASLENFKDLFKSTNLEDLYKTVQKAPFPHIKINHCDHTSEMVGHSTTDHSKNVKCHDASYDSFITGYTYICLSEYLKDELAKSANKLALAYFDGLNYLNIAEENVLPSREHVFVITFPREWNTQKIVETFSVYSPVTIGWISDSSAFVALKNRTKSSEVLKKKRSKKHKIKPVYKIQSYASYLQNQNLLSKSKTLNMSTDSESDISSIEDIIPIDTNLKKTKLSPVEEI